MNSFTAAHILVFDSGTGGLSIVEHIRDTLPAAHISYLADTLFFPYGTMREQALVERVVTLLSLAADRLKPDIIVIACNTASTLVLPALRAKLTIPIVGVVPAIKPAAQLSHSKVIGLLATPGTIRRDYTDELIAEFAPNCEVVRVGCSQLVHIVESVMQGIEYQPSAFIEVLSPFHQHPRWQELDTIVLACTHFPLVKEQLAAAAPSVQYWIDSGSAIARRVQQLLTQTPPCTITAHCDQAFVTGSTETNESLLTSFKRYGFNSISHFR